MRPNLVLMLSFLIFLIGFFSSQVALTGQTIRSDYYTSLSNEELILYENLTVEDCRIASLLSGYDARSNRLSTTGEARGYDPENPFTTKATYQLQHYDVSLDLDQDGRNTALDAKECFDIVYEGGVYARASLNLRPDRMGSCTEIGKTICMDDTVYACSTDALGNPHWVPGVHAGKGQECLNGVIKYLDVVKPWIYLATTKWIDRLS